MNPNKILVALGSGVVIGASIVILTRRISQSSTKIPKLILHHYEHCPYCIRVRLVLGWKGIPYEQKVYGYGDSLGDPKKGKYFGGIELTGRKQLPVLEYDGKLMPESGDIISFLERLKGPGNILLPPLSGRRDLKNFFESEGKFKEVYRLLVRPSNIKMRHLKDWSRQEDIDYCKEKYENDKKSPFNFAAAEAEIDTNIQIMNELLEELDKIVYSSEALSEGPCTLSWDDIHYLPQLHCLTVVKDLKWPKKLKSYVLSNLKKADIEPYYLEQ